MYQTLSEHQAMFIFLTYQVNLDCPIKVRATKLKRCIRLLTKESKAPMLGNLLKLNTNTGLLNVIRDSLDQYYEDITHAKERHSLFKKNDS